MGKRGEGWFALQLVLFGVILLAPPLSPVPFPSWLQALGVALIAASGVLGTWGMIALGSSLSPFPKPVAGGKLVSAGPYALVRHPIYSGLIMGTLGLGLLRGSLLGIVLAVVLFLFFDRKSHQEEIWLSESYPGYPAYQQRVRKLIPFIY
jgi:protein-S-isoprenylcysteine O-methyltransferase Ste14